MFFTLVLIVSILSWFIAKSNILKGHAGRLSEMAIISFASITLTAFGFEQKFERAPVGLHGRANGGSLVETYNGQGEGIAAAAMVSKPVSKWRYSEDRDLMRRTATQYAQVESRNAVDLDFPYGAVHGRIVIRKRPADGVNILFAADKAETLCDSYVGNHISVKFDDGPIKRYNCSGGSIISSEISVIENAADFLEYLKRTKQMIVEAEFYQKGNQQFTFDTAGLEWN